MNNKSKQLLGFTLAEVLITLGIIGVVAALTIPTIVANSQKTQYIVGLKKAYTQMNQALLSVTNDYNCVGDLKCTGLLENTGQLATLLPDALVKYFKVIKNCELNASQGCLPNKIQAYYDGSDHSDYNLDGAGSWYSFVTSDGMSFAIQMMDNGGTSLSNGVTNDMTKVNGQFIVDVNGPQKGPNFYGRDIFWFYITTGHGPKIYPMGGADDGWNGYWKALGCQQSNRNSFLCTGRVMEESWQMNY